MHLSLSRGGLGAGVIAVLGLGAIVAGCGGGGGAAPPIPATVTVDFAQAVPSHSMSGFLLAVDPVSPPDSKILPLQPRFWRTGFYQALYARTTGFGARFCVNCSDVWGYQSHPAPFEDYPGYAARMQEIVRNLNGGPAIFDLWNEPDSRRFWHGSELQFFQTFKVAHDAIRTERPDALIAGPSISSYNHDALKHFLDFCVGKNIRLDVLTWHEFRYGAHIPEISQSLQEARRDFVDNPAYASLGIKEIQINEMIPMNIQHQPASTLAVISQLELGGADAASHACWPDGGQDNCVNRTLDGLLTPGSQEKRSVWWAYKAYADGADARVAGLSNNDRAFVLASSASHAYGQGLGPPQVITGVYGQGGGTVTLVLNHLSTVPSLAGAAKVNVTIQIIPNRDASPLSTLPPPTTVSVPIGADSIQTSVTLGSEDVAVVSLAPA